MFTYGFYDSKDGDRKYNAEQMSSIFDGIIEDGVYSNVGEAMMVVPGSGLQVIVKTGRAWFKHTWSLNDSYMPLSIEPPDVIRKRIDAVVIEVDKNIDARSNSIKVVTGTPATSPVKPTLKHEDGIDQFALAYVTVEPGVDSIAESKIEIAVGKNETPFVQCPLKTVSIEDLFNQWQGEFDEWFDNVQSQLEGDIATNLQNQIDQRVKIADKATVEDLKNKTPNKWVDASMLTEGNRYTATPGTVISSEEDLEALDPDHWARCDQRPMPISRIGKDLGRLAYGEYCRLPSETLNADINAHVWLRNNNPDKLYYYSGWHLYSANISNLSTGTNLTVNTSLPSNGTVETMVREDSIIDFLMNPDNSIGISIIKYSMAGAVLKRYNNIVNFVGSIPLIIGTVGSRIFVICVSGSSSTYNTILYSDDDFDSYRTSSWPFSSTYSWTDLRGSFYKSMDEPFTTYVAGDSAGNLYIVLLGQPYTNIVNSTSSTFIIYKSTDGINWLEIGRVDGKYSGGRMLYGIVNDALYVVYNKRMGSEANYWVTKFNIHDFTSSTYGVSFNKGTPYNASDWYGDAFLVGNLLYIVNNYSSPSLMVSINLDNADLKISPYRVNSQGTLSFVRLNDGSVILPTAVDSLYQYTVDTYSTEKGMICNAIGNNIKYMRISEDGIKIYSMVNPLNNTYMDASIVVTSSGPVSVQYSRMFIEPVMHMNTIYFIGRFQSEGAVDYDYMGYKLDLTKNLLPYKPDQFIALKPPET